MLNQECDDAYSNGNWAYPEKSFYVIHRLCVSPKFQNQGIAKYTMKHIEKELRSLGIEALRLDVFANNPYALRLYGGLGFKEVGFTYWRMGKFYLMEK